MVKRLIGGLVLLNLCTISLDVTAGEVDISDNEVLEQLKELRTFIDEKRNFSKESKQLKPVLVQYRSSASKIDGIVQCNMQFNTDALHLNICGTSIQKDGTPLTITINVVYEYTDYVGYTIKTAKLNATQNQPIFESIVDKNGNKRFIEGVGVIPDTFDGTITYNRWSLSGSHLMIVVAGEVNAGTHSGTIVSVTSLPEWVLDKIIPSSGTYIEFQQVPFYVDYLGTNVNIEVDKTSAGVIIQFTSTTTFESDSNFRIQVDILIDNADED